jgi:MFS family permease
VGVRPVLAAAFRTYRRRFGVIVGAAIVVFGISALVDVLTDVLADQFGDNPGLIALLLTVAGLAVLGTEFFAGLTDRIAGQEERGHAREPLGRVLRTLPYGRLIAADVILAVLTVVFSIALLIPGIIFFTFHALVGPTVVMEDRTVRSAFRRSRQLVRGHFWLVFLLVTLPILFEENVVHGLVEAFEGLGPVAVFVVNALAGAAVGSIVAVIEVTLAHRLAIRKPDPEHVVVTSGHAAPG